MMVVVIGQGKASHEKFNVQNYLRKRCIWQSWHETSTIPIPHIISCEHMQKLIDWLSILKRKAAGTVIALI
jgi:hypothetical protein